jgi:hypothetical protein
MNRQAILLLLAILIMASCKESTTPEKVSAKKRKAPIAITYRLDSPEKWLSEDGSDSNELRVLYALNRTDSANFIMMDTVIVADDMSGDLEYYLPFPFEVTYLKEINKIIFFSYPTQTFAAYEKGNLIYTGPTNMGREKDPTPTGLFFTNWKSEKTTSTFNDEWELFWNFNIANKEGIGWHQYSLPGLPQSHSCLRLQEKDARYLYDWADQWIVEDSDSATIKGTPVIVFGSYNFELPKPWLNLTLNPKGIEITAEEVQRQTVPFISEIIAAQSKREEFLTQRK